MIRGLETMQQRLYTQLPGWMRPSHPVVRYILLREGRRLGRAGRWFVRVAGVVGGVTLLAASYEAYTARAELGPIGQVDSGLFATLYIPLVLLQIFTITLALVMSYGLLAREQQRGTWDLLKVTSHGAEMAIRARWAAVFYQLRWPLILILLSRLWFAGQMLAGLTDYEGRHLDLYTSGITPEVSLEAGILLLAAFMTAALLQPLVMVAHNAALGLYLSSFSRKTQIAWLVRTLTLIMQVGMFSAALVISDQFWRASLDADRGGWAPILTFVATVGDQSLRLMDLPSLFRVWADVDYGVLMGAALCGIMLLQATITMLMLWLAARRAGRAGRE